MRRDFITFGNQDLYSVDFFLPNFEKESPQFLETNEAFLATVDIPGVNSSDIDLSAQENKLIIVAERKNPFDREGKKSYKYKQVFNLPKNVDQEKINAHYENGVLSLTIPKVSEQLIKKKIEITTGPQPKSWTSFLSFKKNEHDATVVSN